MDEPTTLQTPKTNAPFSLASLIAASVSAVSPDWEMAIITSLFVIIGFLYLNSEAYSIFNYFIEQRLGILKKICQFISFVANKHSFINRFYLLLCYTFVFILLPMMYQKHSINHNAQSLEQLPSELYFLYGIMRQPQAFLVVSFHCTIVIVLVTNVLYNYACCVLQSHVGIHYESVIQELAVVTHTTLPTTHPELLSYRRRLSDQLTQRMKEQQQRATARHSSTDSNHHITLKNELTQRRTATATTTSDDPLVVVSSTTVTDTSNSNLSSTMPTTSMQQQQQPSPVSTTFATHAPQQTPFSLSLPPSSTTTTSNATIATPPIRAWMLLGPYEWGYCSQTHQPKPPRSHYDHVTKKLILNLDHYCPWMFNAGTSRFFSFSVL